MYVAFTLLGQEALGKGVLRCIPFLRLCRAATCPPTQRRLVWKGGGGVSSLPRLEHRVGHRSFEGKQGPGTFGCWRAFPRRASACQPQPTLQHGARGCPACPLAQQWQTACLPIATHCKLGSQIHDRRSPLRAPQAVCFARSCQWCEEPCSRGPLRAAPCSSVVATANCVPHLDGCMYDT